jgi:hypothetical protein
MAYWYLATPYTKYKAGREAAYEDASKQAALLLASGVHVYCPIAHTHPISLYTPPELDTHETWLALDHQFMVNAAGLIVCELDGWQESRGVLEEIETFKRAGKPIVHMLPGQVPGHFIGQRLQAIGLVPSL